jgi:hypothetical protein
LLEPGLFYALLAEYRLKQGKLGFFVNEVEVGPSIIVDAPLGA